MRTYPFLSVLLVIAMMISHGSLLTVSQHFHKSDRPSVEATTEHRHFSENHEEPGSATGGGHVHLVGDRVPDDHGLKPVPTGKAIHSGAHRQPFMAPFIMAPLLEPPSIS